MATRQVQKVLSPRGRTVNSLDSERESFEKNQIASISKAVNSIECPVKEKHVRRILIGTFHEKNAATFWSVVRKLPLQENPIVCWKFCHVLHKVLREGHKKAIADSYPFRAMLLDLGKMWGLLKEGYGKLIQNYCTLLVNKIDFHARNNRFPGNLQVSDEELDNIGERDVNVFFQLACEIFDYSDEILSLQASVFGSLDMSRANSMTNAGQCRLAPLIPCIQDSSQLYDYSVKVLFKLHAVLPQGTLDGHRDRFLSQFKILKQFYLNSSNLQYFKNLIHVPLLPENPPNFLLASDINSHVTPVVILPQQADSPDGSEIVDTLIDLTIPQNSSDTSSEKFDDNGSMWSYKSEQQNGSHSAIEEKNRMIHRLMLKIEDLQMGIQQIKIEEGRIIDGLKRRITEQECNAVEQERAYKALVMDRENCTKELDDLRQELARHKAGTDIQTEVSKAVERYQKMRDIYHKLRAEHIELLRAKAEIEKQMIAARAEAEEGTKSVKDLEEQLHELQSKQTEESEFVLKANELSMRLEAAETLSKKLLTEMAQLQQEKVYAEKMLMETNATVAELEAKLIEMDHKYNAEMLRNEWHFLDLVVSETQALTEKTVAEDNEGTAAVYSVNCTPEYFFIQCDLLSDLLRRLIKSCPSLASAQPQFDEMISLLIHYFHQLCFLFNCAKVIYHTLPNIELGQELMSRCKELCNLSVQTNELVKGRKDTKVTLELVNKCLNEIINIKKTLIPEMAADPTKDVGDLLMQELSDMDKAIQAAAQKIEQMMAQAKKKDTGVKLEVNGKILDACTTLMQAILELVQNSKKLQKEIIAQGKGSASATDFYHRNHRWTEGLISAAKVVALAATLLVDAADKVVGGKGKFEELMVASQEIAAATAQLVVASRVKASKESEKMSQLSKSSKRVTEATGNVVATAKSCAQMVEEGDEMDFSKLTLHQAKRLEMDSQVRVLELDNELVKERMKLAGLRKRHYHLAGATEGWE